MCIHRLNEENFRRGWKLMAVCLNLFFREGVRRVKIARENLPRDIASDRFWIDRLAHLIFSDLRERVKRQNTYAKVSRA